MEETIQNLPTTPQQPKPKPRLLVFILIFFTMLIASGGVYWWQSLVIEKNNQEAQATIDQLQQQISNLQNQLSQTQNKTPDVDVKNQLPETNIQVCPEIIYGDDFKTGKSVRIVSIKGNEIDESRVDWAWVRENCP